MKAISTSLMVMRDDDICIEVLMCSANTPRTVTLIPAGLLGWNLSH